MIIINEDEIYHTDNVQDVIEHHGVKGMKWGRRTKRWGSAAGRAAINTLRHPILADKAIKESRRRSSVGTLMGTTRSLEFRNRYVKDMVKANKRYKKDKKSALSRHGDGDDKIFKKYSHDAYFSKRKKADGESRKDYRERQTMARKKMAAAYKDLNNNFDRDIANAKTKRKKAATLAGGRY